MTYSRFLLPLFLIAVPGALAAQSPIPREPDHHLVEVYIKDAVTLDRLVKLDLDLAGCHSIKLPAKTVDVIATDADIVTLKKAGFDFEVSIRNLEDHHERELAKDLPIVPNDLTPALGKGGMGGHYTLVQIVAILDSFVKNHPAICSKQSIGKSLEGRDMWMLKISDNVKVDEDEPEVLYDSLIHAREPLSMETMLLFMDELLTQYGKQSEATQIVNSRELFFIPVMNPDGYEYNRQIRPGGGGMWRKNRLGGYGVDLNRNFSTAWSAPNGGSSTNRNSETYRGASPFSEPETRNHEAFVKTRNFYHVFSMHTYQEVLLRPWGYQRGNPPNNAEYNSHGTRFTAQNGMRHGSAADLLYIASGTTLDHAHVAHGAFGWTPEIGRSSEGGFWPTSSLIPVIARRQQHMLRQVALSAGKNVVAKYEAYGSGCRGTGSGSGNCGSLNAAGGTLTTATFSNEYSYGFKASSDITVTGFKFYTRRVSGSGSMTCALYGPTTSTTPPAASAATGAMTVGTTAGWYSVKLNKSIIVKKGQNIWLSQYDSGTVLRANLTSGMSPSLATYWRRPAGSGAWSASSSARFPAYIVECTGSGKGNAVPVLANSGLPKAGSSFQLIITRAKPQAQAAIAWGPKVVNWPLDALGAKGCVVLTNSVLVSSGKTDSSGTFALTVKIPNDPSLLGDSFYNQGVVLDSGANRLGIAVTQGGKGTVGTL